jgi:hypothetical protein
MLTCARRLVTMRRVRGAWPAPAIAVLTMLSWSIVSVSIFASSAVWPWYVFSSASVVEYPEMSRRSGPTRRMLIEVSPRLRPSSRPAPVGQSSPSMRSDVKPVRNSTKIVMSPAGISPWNPTELPSESPVTLPPPWAARARGSPCAAALAAGARRRAATSASPWANVRRRAGPAPWPTLRSRAASEGTRRPRRSRSAGH